MNIASVPYYSVAGVESVQKNGKICILDIDVQGAEKVKKSSLKVSSVM